MHELTRVGAERSEVGLRGPNAPSEAGVIA